MGSVAPGESHPVWVDTDCGVDDAVALAVLASGGARLAGVSSVHGNVTATRAAANAAGVLARLGIEAPVRIGRTGRHPRAPGPRHGPDGLGGSGWGRRDLVLDGDAASHLAAASRSSGLSVVGLGPATTLAAAVLRDPEIPRTWDRLLLVAGVGERSRDTNTTADPDDMAALLRACDGRTEIVVVAPEARWSLALTGLALDRLPTEAPGWWPVLSGYADAQSSQAEGRLLVLHDALAAAVALAPALATGTRRVPVTARPDGMRAAAGPGRADAVVTWVDRLDPAAGEAVHRALLRTHAKVGAVPA